MIGQNVIDRLKGTADVLLLGRSGLGKSFHLEHYRRVCFESEEVPILLQVRYYQRDLNKAIHKSIGQYTRLAPADLLDAARRLGRRPVLIVDGWNDCPAGMQSDLADDVSAFQLRYNTRVVAAAQTSPSHKLFAKATKVELDQLREEHKRSIFAFHAGIEHEGIPAHWCEPFSTAFDLRLAGQCQCDGTVAETRAELYGSYVRSVAPSVSARAVLRKLAWYMGENFKPVLQLGEYECIVEKFLQDVGLPLSAADELLKSRLLAVDREVLTFEHDLLRDYFRAEHLLRETEVENLAAKLEEPKYTGLAEFVIPSIGSESVVRGLLARAGVDLLNKAVRGWLGRAPKRIVRDECQELLTRCRDRLSEVTVEPSIGEFDDGRRFVSAAHVVDCTCASALEKRLCEVIAANLGDDMLQCAFLELLDVGEWALKEASERIGRERRIKSMAVWRELVHHNVILSHSGPIHPLLFICNRVRQKWSLGLHRSHGLPIREALLKKVREGIAGTLVLLLLISDLRYSESVDVTDVLAISRQAWDTGLPSVRMEGLDFLHSNARAICMAGHEAEERVIALLETFDVKNNIWLSTQWLETRASFNGFETGIDPDAALQEFRSILGVADAGDDPAYQLQLETDPNLSFVEFAGQWASAALSKIFEDVFQGVYYDAYESLSDSEKKKLLTLALQEPRIGFFTDWYLKQLSKFGFVGAEDVPLRYGSRIDPDTFCPQDCVECFILAHEAWAKISDAPMAYRDISSDDHRVWAILGELVFWLNRKDIESSGRISFLCDELAQFPKAAPDVLRQIGRSNKGIGASPVLQSLLARHTEGIRNALHESLRYEGSLTSAFQNPPMHSTDLFRWTLSTLGDIGTRTSISLLRPWTEDATYGKEAIGAIAAIEERLAHGGVSVDGN